VFCHLGVYLIPVSGPLHKCTLFVQFLATPEKFFAVHVVVADHEIVAFPTTPPGVDQSRDRTSGGVG
jgi:hypothetical protein